MEFGFLCVIPAEKDERPDLGIGREARKDRDVAALVTDLLDKPISSGKRSRLMVETFGSPLHRARQSRMRSQ